MQSQQVFGPAPRVHSITSPAFPDEDTIGFDVRLESGEERTVWLNPDDVHSARDLELITGLVWPWDAWDEAEPLIEAHRRATDEDAEPDWSDPTQFFQQGPRGGMTFVPGRLAAAVEWGTALAVGPDNRLWRYLNGAFVPDGEAYIRTRSTYLLGGLYKAEHVSQVVRYFEDRTAHIPLPMTPTTQTLFVQNGAIDWYAGTGRHARPEDAALVQLPVRFDPSADCPVIDGFLRTSLPDDCIDFAYELIGYFALPANPFRTAVLLIGSGANGKSTFLHLLKSFLGERNCASVALTDLGTNRFAPADLFGKLANICGDISSKAPESSELFKKITGGDPIRAEHKGRDAFDFTPFAKMIFSANEPPRTSDVTEAYFRRWLVVPFPYQFSEEEQDKSLKTRMTTPEELSGLLNRAMVGLRQLRNRRRFEIPQSVLDAVGAYREEADPTVTFVADMLEVHRDANIAQNDVYALYLAWAAQNGYEHKLSPNRLYRRVTEITGSTREARRFRDLRQRV